MRKFAALLLLLSLFASFNSSTQAQSRPRRTGQSGNAPVPPAPQTDREANGTSRRPPTLGGAIGTNDKNGNALRPDNFRE